MKRVYVDGRLLAAAEAVVPVTDRGFTLGDGLFETMRVAGGVVFRFSAHLARLRSSAGRIGLPLPHALEDAVTSTVAANRIVDGAVRLTVTRGDAAPGLRTPERSVPRLVVAAYEYRPSSTVYEAGVRALIASGRVNERGAAAGLKHTGYMEAILAQREAEAAGVAEAILLDGRGRLAEAASANLFLVRGDRLLTPSLVCGVLPGITRAAVLELAPPLGIPTGEELLAPELLADCQEAFLTSSLRGIVPLVEVDGQKIGTGSPGALTRRLANAYRALVRLETAHAGGERE
jgi:branched-chain amino acid aminotransferase